MDPAQAVLVAEGPGLAFPKPAGQIVVDFRSRKAIHPQARDCDPDQGSTADHGYMVPDVP